MCTCRFTGDELRRVELDEHVHAGDPECSQSRQCGRGCDNQRYAATALNIRPMISHVRPCGTVFAAPMQRHAPRTRNNGPRTEKTSCAEMADIANDGPRGGACVQQSKV